MFSIEELRLAQKYPFTSFAKAFVKESGVSLENVSDEAVARSRAMVESALYGKNYVLHISSLRQSLENEVLAFPVAKIIVSFFNDQAVLHKFSAMTSKRIFSELKKEESSRVLENLAADLGIHFEPQINGSFFAKVGITYFLEARFSHEFMKIVNQRVMGGDVFLSRNEFCRLLAFSFEQKLLSSLPVETKGLPKKFSVIASELSNNFFLEKKKKFGDVSIGPLQPEFFPPCLEKLYTGILGGKNLSHLERFSLATLLLSAGMDAKNVIDLYRFTPNFNEKITTYQVMHLAGSFGKKISGPSCRKMAEYGLRISSCPCNENLSIKHPLQAYRKSKASKKT